VFIQHILSELPEYVDPCPFVPNNVNERKKRCNEILSLQAKGLIQRIKSTGINNVVIGISGGLDSTLALLVCCIAFDNLKLSREQIHAITMPGFGTTSKTKTLADDLMALLNVNYKCIDIKAACEQHMKDIGHATDVYDVTYENIQARERTQILFDYANMVNGLVIGTGDMSELALGWCTYNGDHMSNYAVNVGVPKTLVKYLVDAYAEDYSKDVALTKTLKAIVDLPISPELLPTDENGNMVQKTEESIGKYDLHDFFLYHYLRNGFGKNKILALAEIAFPNVEKDEIEKTLDTFYVRFRTQQFKRSCIPDGVKVGSVALSPRGDLRLPSDLTVLY
jgi:NAD+ synthase (glutamine-hydrolysing)